MLGFHRGTSDDDDRVDISLKALKTLLQVAAATEDFDEALYLHYYEDVARAVINGTFVSGKHHYLTVGYFEGRRNPTYELDERWYAETYVDAKNSIVEGECSSLLDHYIRYGRSRGYAPNHQAMHNLERWKAALETKSDGAG